MNVVTRGIRNAFRNITRTISIVVILGLSIGLALIMLIAHQAVQDKISTTLSSIGNTISISPAGFSSGSQVNNAMTSSQLAKVTKLSHITYLTETLTDRVQTIGTVSRPNLPPGAGASIAVGGGGSDNNGTTSLKSPVKLNQGGGKGNATFSGGGVFISGSSSTVGAVPTFPSNFSIPITIVGSNHPADPSVINSTSFKVISGKVINGSKDDDQAMISSSMAKKNNVKVGSTFTAYTKTLTIAAIYDSNTTGGDGSIIVSLPTEQNLSAQSGDVTSATATVDSLTNLSSATSAIKKKLGTSVDVTSNIDAANQALLPLNSVKSVSLYALIGSLAAGAAIVLLTMIMVVRDRKREIGIFKAIGFSNQRIMFQFMSEALTLTLMGLVIGLVIGVIGGNPVTSTLVNNSTNNTSLQPMMMKQGGGPLSSGATLSVRSFGGPTVSNIENINSQIGWTTVLFGLLAAIVIALIGSAIASYFISKVKPAEVLRSE